MNARTSTLERVRAAQARATELLDELEAEAQAAADDAALEHLATVRRLVDDAYAATLTRLTHAAA